MKLVHVQWRADSVPIQYRREVHIEWFQDNMEQQLYDTGLFTEVLMSAPLIDPQTFTPFVAIHGYCVDEKKAMMACLKYGAKVVE